jgi:hypothetical protein
MHLIWSGWSKRNDSSAAPKLCVYTNRKFQMTFVRRKHTPFAAGAKVRGANPVAAEVKNVASRSWDAALIRVGEAHLHAALRPRDGRPWQHQK